MYTETDTTPANWLSNAVRFVLSVLDRPAYALLGIVYQIFFNVASADIFANDTVMKFYGRVQLILGVFMIFQLAMTILKGIVNPDTFTGSKDGGGATLIKRIAISLILLTLLMPISMPNGNEFEKQINNNGILFGTLYSLQHRLLSNNTIGRLILGNDDTATYMSEESGSGTNSELEKAARVFSSTIIKGFYRINLVPEDQRTKHEDGKDDAVFNENRVCKNIDDEILAAYTKVDADPSEIISMVNLTCDSNSNPGLINRIQTTLQTATGSTMYIFTYMPIVSFIVPLIFVFILLSFTIDVAVRAVKLAVLRLIAPVPIISYMDPKGSKDSAFNAWVKSLTSTYLDLFIRLASVYFVIFLIQDMINNGISINKASGIVGVFSFIAICIGLFAFARQAPKFIKQVLGMKDDGGKGVFSGFGEISNALGLGAAAVGGIGAFNAARAASRTADIVNHDEAYANNILNRGKHLLAGMAGGVGGLATGFGAAMGAKDHASRAVMEALQKRNATAIARGGSGSTAFGRVLASGARLGLGDTGFDKRTRDISSLKDVEKTGKDLFGYLEGKGKTDGASLDLTGFSGSYIGANGVTQTLNATAGERLRDYFQAKNEAEAKYRLSGNAADAEFTFAGATFSVTQSADELGKVESELAYAAGGAWAKSKYDSTMNGGRGGYTDVGLEQKVNAFDEAGKYNVNEKGESDPISYQRTASDAVNRVKKAFKKAGGTASSFESEPSYRKQKADYGANDKK